MRINKFIASHTRLSRRAADKAIESGRVLVNGHPPQPGQDVSEQDVLTIDGHTVSAAPEIQTVLFNKPAGIVVSSEGQGHHTIYDVLSSEFRHLNPVGRLDKDSSGLLLLTNDGDLAHRLTHPSFQKIKVYELMLDKPLEEQHRRAITEGGVTLTDGVSKLGLTRLSNDFTWRITMHEGRNRQIRRTFDALGYRVIQLHRTQFGEYTLNDLPSGATKSVNS